MLTWLCKMPSMYGTGVGGRCSRPLCYGLAVFDDVTAYIHHVEPPELVFEELPPELLRGVARQYFSVGDFVGPAVFVDNGQVVAVYSQPVAVEIGVILGDGLEVGVAVCILAHGLFFENHGHTSLVKDFMHGG